MINTPINGRVPISGGFLQKGLSDSDSHPMSLPYMMLGHDPKYFREVTDE